MTLGRGVGIDAVLRSTMVQTHSNESELNQC